MAFYQVIFEGKKYASRDMCSNALGMWESALLRAPSKVVLDTLVFGPLTDEQEKKLKNVQYVTQNVDAQIERLVKASGSEQCLGFQLGQARKITYKNRVYVKLSDIKWDKKYANMDRMALVKICGRRAYVALGVKDRDVADPLVVVDSSL